MITLAWNLAHQVRVKAIPEDLVDVILRLGAETVLFNEYVDDPSRDPFKGAMREAGFAYQAVSPTPARHNQIFAASKHAFEVGDLRPPQFDGSAISNFLHLKFADLPFEMVGLRAPAYEKAADRKTYWAELGQIMESARDRAILFTGDINFDPFVKAKKESAQQVPFPFASGLSGPESQRRLELPRPLRQGIQDRPRHPHLRRGGHGGRIPHPHRRPPPRRGEVECPDLGPCGAAV